MFQYKQKVALTYICAYFLDLMNSYMASVAFPKIGVQWHANASQLSWIVTSYVLSLTLIIPISGFLGNKYGTKKLFLISLFLFTTASYLCGQANTIYALIFWRFVQGLGGGLLIPVGQTMLYRQYLPIERSKISATVLIPATVAPMIAPTIGGFAIEHFHWSFLFYFNIPFGIIIFIFAAVWLKEEEREKGHKVDLIGLSLLSLGLFCLLYSCYLFSSKDIEYGLIIFIGSIFILGAFLYSSSRIKNPILNLTLFNHKPFAVGTFLYFILSISFSAVNILIIYFFQNVLGASPSKTGLLMIPFGVGSIVGLKLSSHIYHKLEPKKIISMSLILFMSVGFVFCFINSISQYYFAFTNFLIYGLSVGILANSLQTMSYFHVKKNEMGNASALFNLSRQLGLSLGVSVFSMILSRMLQHKNILNTQQMLYNPTAISIFHLCFFIANILMLFSYIAIRELDKKQIPLHYVIESEKA